MPELRFVTVEKTLDPDLVTQEEEWDVYDDDYPDESLRGERYLVLPEEKGAITFDVAVEVSGFRAGDRVQLDIGTFGGYRAFEIVEPPAGDEPTVFHWEVGPAPVARIGASTFIAFAVGKKKNVVGAQLARYEEA